MYLLPADLVDSLNLGQRTHMGCGSKALTTSFSGVCPDSKCLDFIVRLPAESLECEKVKSVMVVL